MVLSVKNKKTKDTIKTCLPIIYAYICIYVFVLSDPTQELDSI